jgi:hypothetical protein
MGYMIYSTGVRFVDDDADVPDDALYPDPNGI